jgi:hypothetical protein
LIWFARGSARLSRSTLALRRESFRIELIPIAVSKLMANTLLSEIVRLSVKSLARFGGLWAAESGGGPAGHSIADWIHLEAIQLLVYHATAVIAALLLSAVVGFVIQKLMREGPIKHLIILIDEIFVVAVVLFLVAEVGLHFWQK